MTLAIAKLKGGVRAFLKSGLTVKAGCPAACKLAARGTVSGKDARRLHVATGVAAATGKLTAVGTATLHLRVTKKAAGRLEHVRKLQLTVTVVATDAAGVRSTTTRRLTVR